MALRETVHTAEADLFRQEQVNHGDRPSPLQLRDVLVDVLCIEFCTVIGVGVALKLTAQDAL